MTLQAWREQHKNWFLGLETSLAKLKANIWDRTWCWDDMRWDRNASKVRESWRAVTAGVVTQKYNLMEKHCWYGGELLISSQSFSLYVVQYLLKVLTQLPNMLRSNKRYYTSKLHNKQMFDWLTNEGPMGRASPFFRELLNYGLG